MSIDRLLAFIVVGLTALLIGGIGGLLLGATTEQASLLEALARGNLTPDCREQINTASVSRPRARPRRDNLPSQQHQILRLSYAQCSKA